MREAQMAKYQNDSVEKANDWGWDIFNVQCLLCSSVWYLEVRRILTASAIDLPVAEDLSAYS